MAQNICMFLQKNTSQCRDNLELGVHGSRYSIFGNQFYLKNARNVSSIPPVSCQKTYYNIVTEVEEIHRKLRISFKFCLGPERLITGVKSTIFGDFGPL